MIQYAIAGAFALAAVVLLTLTVAQHRRGNGTRTGLVVATVGALASLAAATGLAITAA